MKRFYLMFALILAAFVCKADIITQKPAGSLKYYQRTSGLAYTNDGSNLYLQNQFGFTEIVFSQDGKKAWIKNPVSCFFSEDSEEASWVEATVSGNGTTLEVALGQEVFYDESQQETLLLAMLDKDMTDDETNFLYDKTAAQAIYKIEGDKVSLQGTSSTRILGLIRKSDTSWIGFGDYQTVYTEYALPEPVTPPASMEKKTYKLTAVEYMNEVETKYESQVVVGFDGKDVYIQGIDKFIPNGWVKGTMDSKGAVTFEVQYIGEDMLQRRHFLASWNVGAVGPLTMQYYDEFDGFECTSPVIINSNPTMHNYYAYYRSLFIGERPVPVELPEGLKPVRMIMKGEIDNTGAPLFKKFTRIAAVAVDGDKVYVRGLSVELPEAWACGTLKDNVLTIPAGQYLGFSDISAIYLHGTNESYTETGDIVFEFDSQANSYKMTTTMIEASARVPRSYLWRYKSGLEIYFDPNAPTGADPDDLQSVAYNFAGECYSYSSALAAGEFNRKVSVALDGNLVYVKGFSPELPDAWVKGEMIDNVVTFETCQYLGNADGQDLYFTGVDLNSWKLQDFKMNYNPADESYTFVDLALINKNTASPSYTVWYYNGCKLTKDTAGIEDVTVDAPAAQDAIYNLQGMPVKGQLNKGQIYIINGKKVLYR